MSLVLRCFILAATVSISSVAVSAMPNRALSSPVATLPSLAAISIRYDYDCGRYYPCREPSYHRPRFSYRPSHAAGGVYIARNDGTVNITINGQRRFHRYPRHRYPVFCDDWCDGDQGRPLPPVASDRGGADDAIPPVQCGRYPCDQNCGPSCWYNRFKTGYCGHGCDTYRNKVRFETEDRTIKVPKVIVETRARPDENDDAFVDPPRRTVDRDRSLDRDRTREVDRRRDQDRSLEADRRRDPDRERDTRDRDLDTGRDTDRSRDDEARRNTDRFRDADERSDRQRYRGPAYPIQ